MARLGLLLWSLFQRRDLVHCLHLLAFSEQPTTYQKERVNELEVVFWEAKLAKLLTNRVLVNPSPANSICWAEFGSGLANEHAVSNLSLSNIGCSNNLACIELASLIFSITALSYYRGETATTGYFLLRFKRKL